MPGSNSIRGDESIIFADNLSFDGTQRQGALDTDGQLFIGATSSNRANNGGHVRKGSITSPDSSLTVGYDAPNITLDVNGSYVGKTITGDSGGALSPTAGNWNILGDGSITTSGSGSTLTVQLTGLTNHALLVGAGTTTITKVGPGATYTVLQGNTGADPSFNTNIDLDDTDAGLTQGVISWVSGPRIHNFGTDNIFIGTTAGNGTLTGTDNIGIGLSALNATTNGSSNVVIGPNCGKSLTSGGTNVAMGVASLRDASTSAANTVLGHNSGTNIETGAGGNVAVGFQTLNTATTPTYNTCIGYQAGNAYTGAEAENILIGNGVNGTASETNVTRIGANQTACYIDGIDGVDLSSTTTVVTEASDQLGTAVITAGTGVSVVGGANTITINATGGAFTWVDVTGTSDDLEASTGFIANNAALVTLTLPATCAVGDVTRVAGLGAGGWSIAQNASQTIHYGSSDTTTGAGGSLSSTNQYDAVELLCVATNTDFVVLSSIGNLTVV